MKKKNLAIKVLAATMSIVMMTSGFGVSAAEKSKSSAPELHATGLPIVDPGKYSFSLFVDDSSTTGKYYMMPVLEKQTGIKVELQKFPYAIAKEKFSLALSSGDYADCIGGWTLTDTSILQYGVKMKTFIPLEGYFKKYCPNIEKILALPGVRQTMTAPDGHIYSVPYVFEAPQVDFNPYINTKYLKKFGLRMPKTTTEFTNVLKVFKKNGLIPFSADPDNKHLGYLGGWFGMSLDDFGFTMVGNKLTFGANSDNYKATIKYLNSLYKQGLIDPELFTQDKSQWKAKGAQDKYGVVMMYGSGDIQPYKDGTKPNWAPLPVLSSGKGSPVWLKSSYGTSVLKTQVVVTDKAKNPAAICRWWDNVFALENSIQINNGPLGKVVKKENGGYRVLDTTKVLTKAEQDLYNWSNLWPQSLPKFTPIKFRLKRDNPPYEEKQAVDRAYASNLTKYTIPSYWADKDDANRISDLQTAIKNYIAQKTAVWISGQSNIDKDWKDYQNQLNKIGLKDYVNMRLKALK